MNTSYGQCSLFLHPAEYNFSIADLPRFVSALQATGLISAEIKHHENELSFFAGNNYLDYIAYMGCAPSIQFEAGDNDETFCYLKIHCNKSAKLIYSKIQFRQPQCPNCKKPVKNWQPDLAATDIICDQCQSTAGIGEYNWRKTAGYARLFIEITDIFPKEAVPQQQLLDKLAEITATDWRFFYSCS